MAQYTKHPAAAPPTAPDRESTGHLLLRGYATLTLFTVFAHTAVYNLVGEVGAVIVLALFFAAALAIAIPMIVIARPHPFLWRRLPWTALAYVALALLSVAWSQWRVPTIVTWMLLAAVTVNALLIAHAFTWGEIVHALAAAFKWIVGLSLALELWVSLVVRHPILPNFFAAPEGDLDPHLYWVRDNLFDGGRIQGIVGNSNVLAIISLFAIIAFGVQIAQGIRWRATNIVWLVLAAYLMFRAASATAYLCAIAAAIVLLVALLIRRAQTHAGRVRIYGFAAAAAVLLVAALIIFQRPVFAAIGRSADLTGRTDLIWTKVLERVAQHPIFGNGFSSPWVPSDPAFDGWIVDHGITVFHAHNMWLDVLLQLGVLGLVLMIVVFFSLLWRAWFFAADRPRWDLRANRPYSPETLLPVLFTVVLLVQGIAESTPIMLWGWMLVVLFSFKIKAVPLVGVGLDERSQVTERGRKARRIP